MEVSPKIKTELPLDPAIPVLYTHRKARFQRGRAPGAHLQPQHSGQVLLCEFKPSLVFRVSSRPARAMQQDSVSKKKNNNNPNPNPKVISVYN